MSIRSKIGLDPSNKIDKEYIESQKIDVANSYFTKCVIEPCVHNPDEPFLEGEEGEVESRVTVSLQAAIPSFDNGDIPWPNQHAKQVFVSQRVSGAEMLVHTMHVVIRCVARLACVIICHSSAHVFFVKIPSRGPFAIGDGRSLAIPLQAPMLIIRDPPYVESGIARLNSICFDNNSHTCTTYLFLNTLFYSGGESSVTYSRIETRITVGMEEHSIYR